MDHRPVAGRRKIDLARPGFGEGNKLGDCLDWHRWIDRHRKGPMANGGNRHGVPNEIETELVEKRVRGCVSRNDEKQRMPVGGRTYDRLGGDVARSPRPALDDERLAEAIRQPLPHEPRQEIRWAAGGEAE